MANKWPMSGQRQPEAANKWPSIGDKCVIIAISDFTCADGLLQQSVSVSFVDKSVIAKTVHFVQQQSHEQKTL